MHHATSTSGKSDVKSAVNFLFAQVHQLQAENMLPILPSRKLGLPTEIRRRLLFLAVAALNILPSAHIRRGEEEGGRRYKARDSSAHIRTHTCCRRGGGGGSSVEVYKGKRGALLFRRRRRTITSAAEEADDRTKRFVNGGSSLLLLRRGRGEAAIGNRCSLPPCSTQPFLPPLRQREMKVGQQQGVK